MIYKDVFYFPNANLKTVKGFVKELYANLCTTRLILDVEQIVLAPYKSGVRVLVNNNKKSHRYVFLCGLKLLKGKVTSSKFGLVYNINDCSYSVQAADENGRLVDQTTYIEYKSKIKLLVVIEKNSNNKDTVAALTEAYDKLNSNVGISTPKIMTRMYMGYDEYDNVYPTYEEIVKVEKRIKKIQIDNSSYPKNTNVDEFSK